MAWVLSDGEWIPARHLRLLGLKLTELARREFRRLLVTMPPRHGKSNFISEWFPVWYLSQFPDHRIILASYEADFAAEWGAKVRDHIDTFSDVLGIRVSETSSARNRWDIHGRKGGMRTAGAGGPIVGKGANLLIIDDPVKNDKEVQSETYRKDQFNWLRATALSRLEPGGVAVILMTPWNHDDLSGKIRKGELKGHKWTELHIPAVADEDEPAFPEGLGRKKGEALWSERYPIDELALIKADVGSYWWAALYQGKPMPEEGGLFKRHMFRKFRLTPDGQQFVLIQPDGLKAVSAGGGVRFGIVDLAISLNKRADFTVIGDWHWLSEEKVLLKRDSFRARIEGPDQMTQMKTLFNEKGWSFIGVESVSYQATAVQALRREGFPVRELTPDTDKYSRAVQGAVMVESGQIYYPENASWAEEWLNEHVAFPNAEHDDWVDETSYAAEQAQKLRKLGRTIPVKGA